MLPVTKILMNIENQIALIWLNNICTSFIHNGNNGSIGTTF